MPKKDRLNIKNHGFSLTDAENIEWDSLWSFPDNRVDYGEVRMIGYAYLNLRLLNVVYTDRNQQRRIISLRKANMREINKYANA